MRKLSLDIDALEVESFTASDEPSRMGTIFGNFPTPDSDCGTGCGACTPAGTYALYTCESTCKQEFCTCTNDVDTTCEYTNAQTCRMGENTCADGCAYTQDPATCLTGANYPGC
jgi:hypothetical protein